MLRICAHICSQLSQSHTQRPTHFRLPTGHFHLGDPGSPGLVWQPAWQLADPPRQPAAKPPACSCSATPADTWEVRIELETAGGWHLQTTAFIIVLFSLSPEGEHFKPPILISRHEDFFFYRLVETRHLHRLFHSRPPFPYSGLSSV